MVPEYEPSKGEQQQIKRGGGTQEEEREDEGQGDEARGDVSARGFHTRRRVAIFDIQVSNTDAPTYHNRTSAKVLEKAEKEKAEKIVEEK